MKQTCKGAVIEFCYATYTLHYSYFEMNRTNAKTIRINYMKYTQIISNTICAFKPGISLIFTQFKKRMKSTGQKIHKITTSTKTD